MKILKIKDGFEDESDQKTGLVIFKNRLMYKNEFSKSTLFRSSGLLEFITGSVYSL